ncbi:MAG: hypothetical protein HOQ29_20315 [Acidobacteria bacterium]|nr:hypothetical protein [Acidobacteriota bacterium]
MNEDALRALVRDAIARIQSGAPLPPDDVIAPPRPLPFARHASHYRYGGLPETDGPCLIEPAVQCNHCGYCQSHGH